MKELFIASIAFTALIAGSATAADLARPVYRTPVVYAPVSSWTGFYAGGDLGVAWANSQTYAFSDPGNAAFNSCGFCVVPYQPEVLTSGRKSGLLGGLHVGYNWQFAPKWLVGVEGDFTWTNTLDQSSTAPLFGNTALPAIQPPNAPIPNSLLNFDNQTRWLSSIRGRAGIILASNLLVYDTGGVAWTRYSHTAVASCLGFMVDGCGTPGGAAPGGAISSFSQDQTKGGWVLGAGAEWQIPTTQWRARLEYLYYGFDNGTVGSGLWIALPGGGPLLCVNTPTCSSPYAFSNQNFQTVRLGISYAFGYAAAPAVYK